MIKFYTVTCHYNASYGRYPITVILTNSDPKNILLFQTTIEPPLCLPTWPQVSLMILFTCELHPIFTKLRGFSSISPKRPKGKAKRRSCRRNPWLDKILMDGTEDGFWRKKQLLSGTLVSFWPISSPCKWVNWDAPTKTLQCPRKSLNTLCLDMICKRWNAKGRSPACLNQIDCF